MRLDETAGLTARLADRSPLSIARDWPLGFATIIAAFSLGMVLYLPLENGLIGGLTGDIYWVVRLLPDALICLAAAIAILLARSRLSRYHVMIGILGGVALVILVIDLSRGHGAVDAINATRVLLRYVVLGLIIAACARGLPRFPELLLATVIVAGALQMTIGFVEAFTTSSALGSIPPLAGSTGRYDRFGLLIGAFIIALVSLIAVRPRRGYVLLVILAIVVLFWSTSRQAMIGVAAAGLVVAIWPRIDRLGRVMGLVLIVATTAMFIATQVGHGDTGLGGEDDPPPAASAGPGTSGPPAGPAIPTPPPRTLGSTALSADPNRNFRLYLNLVLGPWAALEEPVFGLGPGRHERDDADPRLIAKVEADGLPWEFARHFVNDSNYASLMLQFGLVATIAFLSLLIGTLAFAARAAWRRPDPLTLFATAFGVGCLAAAAFGPSFEIRQTSIILWLSLFVAIAWRNLAVDPPPT